MQELQRAENTVTEFLAHSAIFVSMSDIWYRKLYKHKVLGAAAADVGALRAVDDVLGQIMVKAFPEVVEKTVAACARATFSALQNTLLNGGEYRYFSLDDSDLLQSDLTAFKACLPTLTKAPQHPGLQNSFTHALLHGHVSCVAVLLNPMRLSC